MSTTVAVVFALLTASANAFAVILQHVATTAGSRRGWEWFKHVMRHPLWLLGWIGMFASLVFQAIALHSGPMSLVQPLLVSELVIALIVRRLWRHQELSRLAWGSAGATTMALAVVLVAMNPRGTLVAPSEDEWLVVSALSIVAVGGLVGLARGAGPVRRAGAFASATAIIWAFEATFIKSATDTVVAGGVGALVTSWSLYALIVTGLTGLTTEQLALREGPLRVSQPLIVIVDPLVSVLYGVTLFHEHLSTAWGALVLTGLGALVVSAGIVVMTTSVPETLVPGGLSPSRSEAA